MCFDFPCITSVRAFLVLRKIRRDITKNTQAASCNVTVILVRSYETLIFTTVIQKNIQMSIFVKIRPVLAVKYSLYYNVKNPSFNQHSIRMTPELKSQY